MPIPEGMHVPNPTLQETDRDARVRFLRPYTYAYGGINLVAYRKGQVADVSRQCAEKACGETDDKGKPWPAAELADGADLFDPQAQPRAAAAKR